MSVTVTMKIGARLASAVCDTQVIVVAAPADDVVLECGGHPMVPQGADVARRTPDLAHVGGTAVGKRYEAVGVGLEVLCTKAGEGSLSVGGTPLELKAPKHLPSSD